MSYKPENDRIIICDTWHCSDGERVHAFFLKLQKSGADDAGRESGAIGHAVSEDMITWRTLPDAVPVGEPGSYDDREHYTGCAVYHDGSIYLYYTSRSSAGPEFSCSLAISNDGIHFEKYKGNPLFTPDERYYYGENNRPGFCFHGNNRPFGEYDYRDLCVHRDSKSDLWYGFFAARVPGRSAAETAVIGLASSTDLIRWEQLPPCFKPWKYHVIETPDVFEMNGKWYMLCLSGNVYGQPRCTDERNRYGRVTIYGVSDRIEGPYHEPQNNVLLANLNGSAACAKTVLHKGKRYIFYTEVWQGRDGADNYMSTPKEVLCEPDGSLALCWYDRIKKYYSDEVVQLDRGTAMQSGGVWGNPGEWKIQNENILGRCDRDWAVQPFDVNLRDFVLETTVSISDAKTAGVFFDAGEGIFGGGLCVLLDKSLGEVVIATLRDFSVLDARDFLFDEGSYVLKVYVKDHTVEVFINDRLVLHHLTDRRAGKAGLFVEDGTAVFSNTEIHTLKEF